MLSDLNNLKLTSTQTVHEKEFKELVDGFFADGGAQTPAATLHELLIAWFTHPDRVNNTESPHDAADMVYTTTKMMTFVIALSENWNNYKQLFIEKKSA